MIMAHTVRAGSPLSGTRSCKRRKFVDWRKRSATRHILREPLQLGYPSLHSDHWDPFWAACEESKTVVCLHLGSSSQLHMTAPDAPFTVQITGTGISLFDCASDLVWSPIFKKCPDLKFSLSEGWIGWIP